MRSSAAGIIRVVRNLIGKDSKCSPTDGEILAALDAYSTTYLNCTGDSDTQGLAGGYIYQMPTYFEISAVDAVVVSNSMTNGLLELDSPAMTISGVEHDPHSAAADLIEDYLANNADSFVNMRSGRHSIAAEGLVPAYRNAVSSLRGRSKQANAVRSIYRSDWLS